MQPKNGSDLSRTVTFIENDGTVTMTATISGLTAENKTIHIHETGDCSANDVTSASGHFKI